MDETDLKILACLKENARMNASLIGEKVSMSVSAVGERIKKLEASGIIKQYTIVLDTKLIDKGISAFISISLEHPKYNDTFIEAMKENTQITECYYITGDFDYLIKVVTSSTESLTEVLNSVKSIQGVSLTRTLFVLSTNKNEFCVLPEKKIVYRRELR